MRHPRSAYRVTVERESGISYVADSWATEAGHAVLDVLRGLYERQPEAQFEKLHIWVQPVVRRQEDAR